MVPSRPRFCGRSPDAERAVSPVVGVALMLAVTVVLAAVVAVMLSSSADPGVAPAADTAVSLEPTDAGTELTTEHAGGQEVDVELNGEPIATIDGSSTGTTVFLPTAPGGKVHLVAAADGSEILLRETFDAGEAGDFVAYYPFDEDGSQLRDRSLHGNHGDFQGGGGDPAWGTDGFGSYREFDGATRSVDVPNLATGDVDVEAFTVTVTFRHAADGGDRQQFVEHNDGTEEWHLETNGDDGVQFAVDYDGTTASVVDSPDGALVDGEVHVVVGTYDGDRFRLYLDGTEVDTSTRTATADMGRMRIGNDDSGATQYFDGRMYEFRLYHAAFDDHEVEMLTEAMDYAT